MDKRIGQEFGAYHLIAQLGRSSYAEVYLGEHKRMRSQAALKLLTFPSTSWGWTAFQQTGQKASGLIHPRIARVLDFDQQTDIFFLVLEYLPNGSLERWYAPGMRIPLDLVVKAVQQTAEALQYAHSQHMLHLGIKPANLLLNQQQDILVSDFGLSAFTRHLLPPQSGVTEKNAPYLAPEQIQGQVGPASDQYALAICAYELLRGSAPFQGNVSEIITGHLSSQPPALLPHVAGLPLEVEQVLLTALNKDPAQRFRTIQAFSQAFEQASQARRPQGNKPVFVAPIPSASVQGSVTSPQASADLGQAEAAPVPSLPSPQLAQSSPQTFPVQGQAVFPQPVPAAPTPQRISRRALIGSALGVGAAGVLTTLCTHTAWFSFFTRSTASSSIQTTLSPLTPDPRLLAIYRGNKNTPGSLVWSPDSTKLTSTVYSSSTVSKSIHTWNALTNGPAFVFDTPSNGTAMWTLDDAAWTPEGPYTCWTPKDGGGIYLTNLLNGHSVLSDPAISAEIFTSDINATFSPDGKYLAIAAHDVLILDTVTGKNLVTLPHPDWTELTEDVYWSPDGKRIAARYSDQTRGDIIIIWNPFSRTQVSSLSGPTSSVLYPPAWTSNGRYIAAFYDQTTGVSVFDSETGKLSYVYPVPGNEIFIDGWSADDSLFAASTEYAGSTSVWSASAHTLLHTYNMGGSASWAPNSSRLAAQGNINAPLSVWDAATGQHITDYSYRDDQGRVIGPTYSTWSPNGRYLAAAYGKVVCVWKAPT